MVMVMVMVMVVVVVEEERVKLRHGVNGRLACRREVLAFSVQRLGVLGCRDGRAKVMYGNVDRNRVARDKQPEEGGLRIQRDEWRATWSRRELVHMTGWRPPSPAACQPAWPACWQRARTRARAQ